MLYDISDRFDILCLETVDEGDKRRLREKEEREKRLKEIEKKGECERSFCDEKENLEWIPSMTRYHWDIDKEPQVDPNRPHFLCPVCAEEYISYWEERWAEYYGGCM